MNSKIDINLLTKAKVLTEDKKINCIIKAVNFFRLREYLEREQIEIIKQYPFINSFYVNITKREIEKISNLFSVEYVYSVATASTMINVSKKILGCDETPLKGTGIGVAIIDTGVAPHLDFCLGRNRLKKSLDFVNEKTFPYDDNGHGTFVCGVMAGSGAESAGKYSGIASDVDIVSIKALNAQGEAYSNKILEGMEWVYDNHKKENIKVVCMSFGSEPLGLRDPIMSGAEALWNDGVVVVCAAGNSGPEFQTIKSPGVSQKIITVGGFNDNRSDELYSEKDFEIAEFSSRGPAFNRYKPDLIAPAVDIKSCDKNGGYTILSGTSVATPMIAGLACLVLEKYPKLSPNEVKSVLGRIARPISFNRNAEGLGVPDLKKLI